MFRDDINLKLNKTSFKDFSVDESFKNFLNIFADIVNTHTQKNVLEKKRN